GEPARQKNGGPGSAHGVLELGPAHGERLTPQVAALAVQDVEYGEDVARGAALQELKPGNTAPVEGHGLAVEQQGPVAQPPDRLRDLGERRRPVEPVSREERDARAFLVREDAVSVVLLLEDPSGAVEGLVHERREHRADTERDAVGRAIGMGGGGARGPAARRSLLDGHALPRCKLRARRRSSTMHASGMRDILAWALTTEILGLAVLPLLRAYFGSRRDAALLSRPLGLAIVAYLGWALALLLNPPGFRR